MKKTVGFGLLAAGTIVALYVIGAVRALQEETKAEGVTLPGEDIPEDTEVFDEKA